ncbi:MAG: hypothetical protein ABI645_01635 [Pseudomonadota bacterium]
MKKLVPVLMVVLSALTIAAVYLWQELSEVRTQTSELKTHVTELQSARLAAATVPALSPSGAAVLQPSAVETAGAAATSAVALPATAAGAEKKPNNALQEIAKQMLGTPEGQEMMKAQLRMMLPQRFPDIGKELGLTPAETEKLFDVLAKQQMGQTTLGLDVLSGNGMPDSAAMQEKTRKLQQDQQAELAALLGDKLPQYQNYQKNLPMRRQVSQLQSTLGTGNNALSDTQAKPLISALAAEQTRIQQDRSNAPRPAQPQQRLTPQQVMEQQTERQIARAAEDSRRMISVATSYLNPQQLESYRKMLEQQQSLESTLIRSIGSQVAPQINGGGQPAPAPAAPR